MVSIQTPLEVNEVCTEVRRLVDGKSAEELRERRIFIEWGEDEEGAEGHWDIAFEATDELADDPTEFPNACGPFSISVTPLRPSVGEGMYELELTGPLSVLQQLGVLNIGSMSPVSQLTLNPENKELARIPQAATHFAWGYPLVGVGELSEQQKMLLNLSDPSIIFAVFGGFVYLDANRSVVQVNAIGKGMGLSFSPPQKWPSEYTRALVSGGRMQEITIQQLKDKGACYYCWICPREVLTSDGVDPKPWTPCENGGFVYLFHQNALDRSDKDCFFAVEDKSKAAVIQDLGQSINYDDHMAQEILGGQLEKVHQIVPFSSFTASRLATPRKPIAQSPRDVEKLKRQISALEVTAKCVICASHNKTCVFHPCLHFAACSECAPVAKTCPMCHKEVENVMAVFA